MEKGDFGRRLDDALRSPLERAVTLLKVRSWLQESEARGFAGSLADLLPLSAQDRAHLHKDWFGNSEQAFWVGIDGAGTICERVCASGLLETLECSLGLTSLEPIEPYCSAIAEASGLSLDEVRARLGDASGSRLIEVDDQHALRRNLPVDVYWVCDLPLFEAYVSWNERQVTVVIATPAVDSPMFRLLPRKDTQEEAKRCWSRGMLVVQSGAPDEPTASLTTTALLDRRLPAAEPSLI